MEQPTAPAMLENEARIEVATAVSRSLSLCMERKYLENITKSSEKTMASLESLPAPSLPAPVWIHIRQVGRPVKDSAEDCFTAIQKILHACFLPKTTQLLFLITGSRTSRQMYLGVRSFDSDRFQKRIVKNIAEFMKGIWPGLQCETVSDSDNPDLRQFRDSFNNGGDSGYECCYALTGIPSMQTGYKTVYPATMDKFLAGMNKSRNFAYLVVADPLPPDEVDGMLHECRELDGRAASLKTFNVSENMQHTRSQSTSSSESQSQTKSRSTGVSMSLGILGNLVNPTTAVQFAGMVFPPAALLGLLPGISRSSTTSTGTTTTQGRTEGMSESQGKSVSRTIVNKHIESVAEHLFTHSQRLESGKAIGAWKTGVYLLADREADAQSAALQLRSIMSGQESVFEPIRFHDITPLLETQDGYSGKTHRELSLGRFSAPVIRIRYGDTHLSHPLGSHYDELKTVLTTKELSYFINFPLRSTPGINVVDSTSEFSLRQPETGADDPLQLGKLLYGGSATDIACAIPPASIARHGLVCGMRGSGKTTTVHTLLESALSRNIPFLVIEPSGTDSLEWALAHNARSPQTPIGICMPGCDAVKSRLSPGLCALPEKLALNPFEAPGIEPGTEADIQGHMDRLKIIFAAAFPPHELTAPLVDDLLYALYEKRDFSAGFPTLQTMREILGEVMGKPPYDRREERAVVAAFRARIESLSRDWKGETLNVRHSMPLPALFERPLVVNLSRVADEADKTFFMALLFLFLHEYRAAGGLTPDSGGLRHITVIEEARRILGATGNPVSPRDALSEMLATMLNELGAQGEGVLLVEQSPLSLVPQARRNTGVKIAHRLPGEDDIKVMGESMGLSADQRKIIGRLGKGQAIVTDGASRDVWWVEVGHKERNG